VTKTIPPPLQTQLINEIDHLVDLLQLEKESGRREITMEPFVLKNLQETAQTPAPAIQKTYQKPPPSPSRTTRKTPPETTPKTVVPTGLSSSEVLPDSLPELTRLIAKCKRCPLHQWRTNTVSGTGSDHPDIMFIGEGPGRDEDLQGFPFVGRSGAVLTRMIEKMGYTRETVFIGNIVKCRPTVKDEGKRDRPPTPEEMDGCLPYLKKQIALLKPKVLILLGNTAMQGLFGFKGISKRRGKWLTYEGIDISPILPPEKRRQQQ